MSVILLGGSGLQVVVFIEKSLPFWMRKKDKMSVERFDMENVCHGEYNCGMIKSDDGEFIAFTDYQAAETKVAKIRELTDELLTPPCPLNSVAKKILAILDEK